ncbi:MAG: NifB/NifX family molybdenum-iron cluster-binding protein [Anaerolineae bacterium]
MKIAISASRGDINAPVDPRFGRCPYYVFADTESDAVDIVPNEAVMAGSGAGIQAAQSIARRGVQAVITGNVGPNAFQVFDAAGVTVHTATQMTVSQAIEAFKAGNLPQVGAPTGPAHAGMGGGMGMGRGMGMDPNTTAPSAPPAPPQDELRALKQEVGDLRKSVATLLEKVDELTQKS